MSTRKTDFPAWQQPDGEISPCQPLSLASCSVHSTSGPRAIPVRSREQHASTYPRTHTLERHCPRHGHDHAHRGTGLSTDPDSFFEQKMPAFCLRLYRIGDSRAVSVAAAEGSVLRPRARSRQPAKIDYFRHSSTVNLNPAVINP